jgi:hypothetical protein
VSNSTFFDRPIILVKKARRLRRETGDSRYYAPMEETKIPFAQRANKVLAMPFKILFQEPVLVAVTLYMSVCDSSSNHIFSQLTRCTQFAYGCMYLLFEAYPIVFNRDHHLDAGIAGLAFLPFGLGGVIGCLFVGYHSLFSVPLLKQPQYLVFYTPAYNKLIDQYAPHPVPPEAHLSCTRLAAVTYAISFFWFGWTSYSYISFWSSMMAGGLLGFSVALIFVRGLRFSRRPVTNLPHKLSLFNYIIGMYLFVAASALAGVTLVRSLFGAVFPVCLASLPKPSHSRSPPAAHSSSQRSSTTRSAHVGLRHCLVASRCS